MGNAALKISDEEKPQKKYSQVKVKHSFDDIFTSSSYSVEQPFFQILKEGYTIHNSDGTETYNAVRYRHWKKQLLARFSSTFAFIATGGPLIFLIISTSKNPSIITSGIFISILLSFASLVFVYKYMSPKRITTLFKGEGDDKKLFTIAPTSGVFFFNREYKLIDHKDNIIVIFKRPFFESLFRIRWHATTKKGKYLFTAIEDSLIMALLRRYLNMGRLIPLHFNMTKGGGKPFGSFKRRFSIRDKYQLTHDPKAVPSWILIATAILLDTGERR